MGVAEEDEEEEEEEEEEEDEKRDVEARAPPFIDVPPSWDMQR